MQWRNNAPKSNKNNFFTLFFPTRKCISSHILIFLILNRSGMETGAIQTVLGMLKREKGKLSKLFKHSFFHYYPASKNTQTCLPICMYLLFGPKQSSTILIYLLVKPTVALPTYNIDGQLVVSCMIINCIPLKFRDLGAEDSDQVPFF
jgi:hypothetical protein